VLTHSQVHEVIAVPAGGIEDSLELRLDDWLVSRDPFVLEQPPLTQVIAAGILRSIIFKTKQVSLRSSLKQQRGLMRPPWYEDRVGGEHATDQFFGCCPLGHARESESANCQGHDPVTCMPGALESPAARPARPAVPHVEPCLRYSSDEEFDSPFLRCMEPPQ